MTTEQVFFLKVLRNHLNKEMTVISDLDFDELFRIAQNQQMSAIVYYQCKSAIDVMSFRSSYYSAVSQSAIRNKAASCISKALTERGISYFFVKGTEVAKYYPQPALRTMGDLDILTNNRDSARIVLEQLGFESIIAENADDWKFFSKNLEIELHDRLLYDSPINTKELKAFFNNSFKYVADNGIDNSFHLLFLLVHIRKHLMSYGVGFRQFFDVAVMVKNCTDLDWNWIEEKMIELKLLRFAHNVFALIERWFGVVAPLEYEYLSDELYALSTEYIFKGGVFGFENEDTMKNDIANRINNSKHPFIASWKRNLAVVFPGYKTLLRNGEYDFLNNRPILLPIAWLIRTWNILTKSDVGSIQKKINQRFVSTSYAEGRQNYLSMWGL